MKQTIDEKAEEYRKNMFILDGDQVRFDSIDIGSARYVAFKAGAQWQAKQNQWIKAKDQLPSVNENDISEQSAPVLVKVASKGHYEPEILVYNKHYHVWDTADADDYSCNISDEDLWMPIPAFEE